MILIELKFLGLNRNDKYLLGQEILLPGVSCHMRIGSYEFYLGQPAEIIRLICPCPNLTWWKQTGRKWR